MPTYEDLPTREHRWVCELCYTVTHSATFPPHWELIFQSAICPSCIMRSLQEGKFLAEQVGGTYAKGRLDPRDLQKEKNMSNDYDMPDPIQRRRDENLQATADVADIEWMGGWFMGPGVMQRHFKVGSNVPQVQRHFKVNSNVYRVQIAGFDGNLAELYAVCIKVSQAVSGDYAKIIENADVRGMNSFMIDKVVISIR